MERGYVVDHGYGAIYPSAWVAGLPEWSRWTGLKLRRKPKLPIATYRCPGCGRLESFATSDKWPG
jgi:hypothetical protein